MLYWLYKHLHAPCNSGQQCTIKTTSAIARFTQCHKQRIQWHNYQSEQPLCIKSSRMKHLHKAYMVEGTVPMQMCITSLQSMSWPVIQLAAGAANHPNTPSTHQKEEVLSLQQDPSNRQRAAKRQRHVSPRAARGEKVTMRGCPLKPSLIAPMPALTSVHSSTETPFHLNAAPQGAAMPAFLVG